MDVTHRSHCEPVELLRTVPLFADLDEEYLEELACRVRPRDFETEETIFRRGDPGDFLFVIERGRVRIEFPSPEGPPVILNVLEPGEFFGELALCDGKPRSASAVAMEPAHALALHHPDFHDFLRSSPRAALQIITVLSERLRETGARLSESVFYDTASRLARRLLALAESEGGPAPPPAGLHGPAAARPAGVRRSIIIPRALSIDDLAEMAGTTADRIRQELDSLEQDQIIALRDGHVTVLNPSLLRERIQRKPTVAPGSVTIPTWLLD